MAYCLSVCIGVGVVNVLTAHIHARCKHFAYKYIQIKPVHIYHKIIFYIHIYVILFQSDQLPILYTFSSLLLLVQYKVVVVAPKWASSYYSSCVHACFLHSTQYLAIANIMTSQKGRRTLEVPASTATTPTDMGVPRLQIAIIINRGTFVYRSADNSSRSLQRSYSVSNCERPLLSVHFHSLCREASPQVSDVGCCAAQ